MKRVITVALALVMVFALTISAAAKDSPTGKEFYSITTSTDPADGSLGTASASKDKISKTAEGDDAKVTLTANPTKGSFNKWSIDGDYDIVSGDLNSTTLVIIPKSDVNAVAVYKSSSSTASSTASSSSGKDSSTSPKTGDPLYIILGLAVLALGAGALAVKKIKEN